MMAVIPFGIIADTASVSDHAPRALLLTLSGFLWRGQNGTRVLKQRVLHVVLGLPRCVGVSHE